MAWTDERVELLKKLWSEGLSASQIAGRLGGVTRNAVIGKVHRLGLSGRATSSRSSVPRPRRNHTPRQSRAPSLTFGTRGNAALKPTYEAEFEATPAPAPVEELVIPLHERATILTLNEVDVPLAHRRPERRIVSFLRTQEKRFVALLRAPCLHGVSAGAIATAREALRPQAEPLFHFQKQKRRRESWRLFHFQTNQASREAYAVSSSLSEKA